MSQEQLADQLGIRQNLISKHENGTTPSPPLMARIARFYDMSLSGLYRGTE